MAQTFRDFFTECELYPYSEDYFRLLKENYEITMMDKYIENQVFVMNDVAEYTEAGVVFSESYFPEAAVMGYLAEAQAELTMKKDGFLTKLRVRIVKLLEKFVKFFNGLMTKIQTKIDDKRRAMAEKNINIGKNIMMKAVDQLKSLKEKYPSLDLTAIQYQVALDLYNNDRKGVTIKPANGTGETPISVKALEAVVSTASDMFKDGDFSSKVTDSVLKIIEDAQNDARKNGITVEAKGNEKATIDKIEAEIKTWVDTSSPIAQRGNKPAKQAQFDRNNLEDDNGMAVPKTMTTSPAVAEVYKKLTTLVAADSKFYTDVKTMENEFLDMISDLRNQGVVA